HAAPYLPPGDYVVVRIRDTGIGMDAQTPARLFEPFFTTKEAGQGTTFSLYFHAVEPAMKPAGEEPQGEAVPIQGGTETILLVEDDPDIQAVLVDTLQEYGYSILIAGDGEVGLRLFEEHASSIGLVIADIMMPKMQGRAFQEQVRQQRAGLKVLVMSGYQEMDLKRRNLLDPDSVFLQKPFDLDVFAATIRKLLGKGAG
ncbi:MAG TPA: response regulator, partial [Ktedonobacterales bacterium]|nr:response regulator [Ktedonobacterales bacterium]